MWETMCAKGSLVKALLVDEMVKRVKGAPNVLFILVPGSGQRESK